MFSLDDRAVFYPASSSREWRDSCLSIDTRTTLHVILVTIYVLYTLYKPEIRASKSDVLVDTLHSASRMSRFSDGVMIVTLKDEEMRVMGRTMYLIQTV
jgi:hypothetical protein